MRIKTWDIIIGFTVVALTGFGAGVAWQQQRTPKEEKNEWREFMISEISDVRGKSGAWWITWVATNGITNIYSEGDSISTNSYIGWTNNEPERPKS